MNPQLADEEEDNLKDEVIQLFSKCTHILVMIFTLPVTGIVIAYLTAIPKTFEFDVETDIATWNDRPHTIPYFLGNNHYHEFGDVYGYTVVIHAFCGVMANIMLIAILPSLFTENKSMYHYIFGCGVLLFSMLLYTAGESCGAVLIINRTFHPCAYYIGDQTADVATSFPFLLYMQYSYYGPWLVEMLSYGIIYVLYREQDINKLPKYIGYICCYFSIVSIFFNITRVILFFFLISKRDEYLHKNCGSGHSAIYDESTAIIIATVAIVFEWPTSIISIINLKFMIQRENGSKWGQYNWMTKMHGKCFYIASGIIVWTLFANGFWKLSQWVSPLWNIATFVSYFFTAIVLSFLTITPMNKFIKSKIYGNENFTPIHNE